MVFRILLCCFAALSFDASAQSDDDGFIWIDANTRIKVKPLGAAAGPTKAPEEPKKDKKPQKPDTAKK